MEGQVRLVVLVPTTYEVLFTRSADNLTILLIPYRKEREMRFVQMTFCTDRRIDNFEIVCDKNQKNVQNFLQQFIT
jgi:hypothetical protein